MDEFQIAFPLSVNKQFGGPVLKEITKRYMETMEHNYVFETDGFCRFVINVRADQLYTNMGLRISGSNDLSGPWTDIDSCEFPRNYMSDFKFTHKYIKMCVFNTTSEVLTNVVISITLVPEVICEPITFVMPRSQEECLNLLRKWRMEKNIALNNV